MLGVGCVFVECFVRRCVLCVVVCLSGVLGVVLWWCCVCMLVVFAVVGLHVGCVCMLVVHVGCWLLLCFVLCSVVCCFVVIVLSCCVYVVVSRVVCGCVFG